MPAAPQPPAGSARHARAAGRKWTPAELHAQRSGRDDARMEVAVLLAQLRSMHNVGSVFRTAECFAAREIWLAGYTPRPPRHQIARVALGAERTLPWRHTPGMADAARAVRAAGYVLIAAELTTGSVDLAEFAFPFPCCIAFGHEVEGLTGEVLELCDAAVHVPMWGRKESLNVSVCAGVVLHEVRRQWLARGAAGPGG